MRTLALFAAILALALPVEAQLWDSLTNPKVTVTVNHPPGLELNVKKIAFAPL